MKIEFYEHEKHHPLVSEWWTAHGHPVLPKEALSDVGYVVYSDDDVPLVCSWGFMTSCKMGWIGWTVSNPVAGMRLKKAIHLLYYTLEEVMRAMGYCYVVYMSSSRGLTSVLRRRGYNNHGKQDLMIGRL